MKIIRSISNDGNLNTDLKSFLTQIQDKTVIFHYNEYSERHPLAIYNISETSFLDAYKNLLDYLGNQTDLKKFTTGNDLHLKTKEVLGCLISFIDDIYIIFKCFYSSSAAKKQNIFVDKWLEDIDKDLIQEFKRNISFTHDFRLANNYIKHNHGRLSVINAKSFLYGNALGFFIQKADSSGAVVPNEEIHKKYFGRHTAYSYNWFLLEILAQFYFISKFAVKTLQSIIFKNNSIQLNIRKIDDDSLRIKEIINSLDITLTKLLFEDEFGKPCSQIEIIDEGLIVKSPADKSYLKKFYRNQIKQIELVFSADGLTTSWAIPYL